MEDNHMTAAIDGITKNSKRRFVAMIIGSIIVAFILVLVSMHIYNSSGAAQLDLSRPGYVSVRSQANDGGEDINYSNKGAIDQSAIDEFQEIFSEQVKNVKSVDAFGGDPLSAKSLGLTSIVSK
ncbi:MAG: hypothetical protein WA087_02650 [Candidatus Saccharimonadales bacterium]